MVETNESQHLVECQSDQNESRFALCVKFPSFLNAEEVEFVLKCISENAKIQHADSSAFARARIIVFFCSANDTATARATLIEKINGGLEARATELRLPKMAEGTLAPPLKRILNAKNKSLLNAMSDWDLTVALDTISGIWAEYSINFSALLATADEDDESESEAENEAKNYQDGWDNGTDPRTMNKIALTDVKQGDDDRRAIILRNVPNRLDTDDLIQLFDHLSCPTFEYLYLPVDHMRHCNLGYAFIKLHSHKDIVSYYEIFHGFRWGRITNSKKIGEVAYGRSQELPEISDASAWNLVTPDGECARPAYRGRDPPNDVCCAKSHSSRHRSSNGGAGNPNSTGNTGMNTRLPYTRLPLNNPELLRAALPTSNSNFTPASNNNDNGNFHRGGKGNGKGYNRGGGNNFSHRHNNRKEYHGGRNHHNDSYGNHGGYNSHHNDSYGGNHGGYNNNHGGGNHGGHGGYNNNNHGGGMHGGHNNNHSMHPNHGQHQGSHHQGSHHMNHNQGHHASMHAGEQKQPTHDSYNENYNPGNNHREPYNHGGHHGMQIGMHQTHREVGSYSNYE